MNWTKTILETVQEAKLLNVWSMQHELFVQCMLEKLQKLQQMGDIKHT